MPVEPRRARREIAAVVFTGATFLLFESVLHAKGPFIAIAIAGWGWYVVGRMRRDRAALTGWGFGAPGLRSTALAALAILLAGGAAMAAIGAATGRLSFSWHILPLLALYPVWGLTQHFLLQALVARNLDALGLARAALVPTTALLFAVVHFPDAILMAATFLLALLFTPIYLAWRNLWPLGVVHGWLGAMAYFWLLGRDPWMELLH